MIALLVHVLQARQVKSPVGTLWCWSQNISCVKVCLCIPVPTQRPQLPPEHPSLRTGQCPEFEATSPPAQQRGPEREVHVPALHRLCEKHHIQNLQVVWSSVHTDWMVKHLIPSSPRSSMTSECRRWGGKFPAGSRPWHKSPTSVATLGCGAGPEALLPCRDPLFGTSCSHLWLHHFNGMQLRDA